jgi:hypothetical protein
MTGEGWSTMMYTQWGHHNFWLVSGFHTFLILFGVFFTMNLFLAVISDSYTSVQQDLENEEFEAEKRKKQAQMAVLKKFMKVEDGEGGEGGDNGGKSGKGSSRKKSVNLPKDPDEEEQEFLVKNQKKVQGGTGKKGGKSGAKGGKGGDGDVKVEDIKSDDALNQDNIIKELHDDNEEEKKELKDQAENGGNNDVFADGSGTDSDDDEDELEDDDEDSSGSGDSDGGLKKSSSKGGSGKRGSSSEEEEDDEGKDFWAVKVIKTNEFMTISIILILGNTLVLAFDSYNNNTSTLDFLENMNKNFTYIFTVEMVFKIYALGFQGYVRDGYNLFDGILVCLSLVDIGLQMVMGKSTGASVLSVFRTLRLMRVFKLATKSKGLLILLTVRARFLFLTFLGYHEDLDRYLLLLSAAGAVHLHLRAARDGGLRLPGQDGEPRPAR